MVGRALDIEVAHRGSELRLAGDARSVDVASRVMNQLYALVADGHVLHPMDVRHAVGILQDAPDADLRAFFADTILTNLENRPIAPRSAGQRAYVHALRAHDIVFGVGPAGTGKTYLAMAMAVAALKRSDVKRIILTRPAVEAGEKLGFLPGDLTEKVDPYLRPLYDALADMIPQDRMVRLFEKRVIEVAPLAFMRGRTLDRAYVVLDEAQNTTREQMKMFLTRMGNGSRMVITGDVTQIDLPRRSNSGMIEALRVLSDIERIGVVHLSSRDVVRHPLVAEIIEAYAHASPGVEQRR
ncbi:MAG: phosphate starvation-inducible PhoH-like protein [Myxococcota bacterium]|jgi:phosphate starvation-inducible PhoH-like protein